MVGEKPNELELLGANQGPHGRFVADKTAKAVVDLFLGYKFLI
jgi:hypothetical protein